MTWMQIGVSAAVAAAAFTAWFGIWNMADRRFAELRGAIDRANENNDKAHGDLRAEIRAGQRETSARLDALAADVHVLVGRQQERDRVPAD